MKWQYKTILFEFRKDGLLGDRYIDDEETENVLNDQGSRGWELVSVTPVQEGLLSFFKRALSPPRKQVGVKPDAAALPSAAKTAPAGRPVIKQPLPEKQAGEKSGSKPDSERPGPEGIGSIKIR